MKKFAIATSDWHLRERKPQNRLPGFQQQQYEKIKFIFELCKKYKTDLLNAGDVFDTARVPRWLVSKYMKLFTKYPNVIHYACSGQHDMVYHSSNLRDTSIQLLFSSGLVKKSDSNQIRTVDWGGSMEAPTNIMIAHFCVTEKPIEFIDYSLTAGQFMKKARAMIMVTGDYHVAHHLKRNGKLLVNPGSIVRMGVDSFKRKPSVYLIDTVKCEIVDQIFIPMEPAEEVFDIEGVEKQKAKAKRKEELTARFDHYIEQATTKQEQPNFEKNLTEVIEHDLPKEETRTEIDFIMEEVR